MAREIWGPIAPLARRKSQGWVRVPVEVPDAAFTWGGLATIAAQSPTHNKHLRYCGTEYEVHSDPSLFGGPSSKRRRDDGYVFCFPAQQKGTEHTWSTRGCTPEVGTFSSGRLENIRTRYRALACCQRFVLQQMMPVDRRSVVLRRGGGVGCHTIQTFNHTSDFLALCTEFL